MHGLAFILSGNTFISPPHHYNNLIYKITNNNFVSNSNERHSWSIITISRYNTIYTWLQVTFLQGYWLWDRIECFVSREIVHDKSTNETYEKNELYYTVLLQVAVITSKCGIQDWVSFKECIVKSAKMWLD